MSKKLKCLIKLPVIELKNKILSISDGPTDGQ